MLVAPCVYKSFSAFDTIHEIVRNNYIVDAFSPILTFRMRRQYTPIESEDCVVTRLMLRHSVVSKRGI